MRAETSVMRDGVLPWFASCSISTTLVLGCGPGPSPEADPSSTGDANPDGEQTSHAPPLDDGGSHSTAMPWPANEDSESSGAVAATSGTTDHETSSTTEAWDTDTGETTGHAPEEPPCINVDPFPGDVCYLAEQFVAAGRGAVLERDGDGLRDLVIAIDGSTPGGAKLEFYPGLPGGGFSRFPGDIVAFDWATRLWMTRLGTAGGPESLFIGARSGNGPYRWFTLREHEIENEIGSPFRHAVGDFDGDGDDDLLWFDDDDLGLWHVQLLGEGSGSAHSYRVGDDVAWYDDALHLEVGDANGDGIDDVMLHGTSGAVENRVRYSFFAGGRPGPWTAPVSLPDSPVLKFTIGDVNGDGNDDCVLTDARPMDWDPPPTFGLMTALSDGTGGFSEVIGMHPSPWIGGDRLVDMDADDDLDLFGIAALEPPAIEWMENDGTGQFEAPRLLHLNLEGKKGWNVWDVEDRNGDGFPDFVVGMMEPPSLWLIDSAGDTDAARGSVVAPQKRSGE